MLATALDGKPRSGAAPDFVDRVFGSGGWGRVFFPLAAALLADVGADAVNAHPALELGCQATLATIVFMVIQLAMTSRQQRRSASPIRIAAAAATPATPQLSAAAHSHRHDIVRLTDLVGVTPAIDHQVFEDCDIIGPAVIWMTRAWFEDCTILEDGQTILVRLENEHPPAGTIILQDCLFRRCRFHRIGIAGSAADLERFRSRLTPAQLTA